MTTPATPGDHTPVAPTAKAKSHAGLIGAGLVSWIVIAVGFLGLYLLMQERPEFVGQPMRSAKTELVQSSPVVVLRKVSDDIAVIKHAQPDSSEIAFDMRGRRDYRGLRTTIDMSGNFHARHVLTNPFDEPVHMLFICPHPRANGDTRQSLLAGGLKLVASAPGIQENASEAWLWSGKIGRAHV